jgi:membrane protease YdiL (CAAX protease family)
MTRAAMGKPAAKAKPAPAEKWEIGYFERAERPLYGMIFLLPMMALFEIGTYFHPSEPIAFRFLQVFFHQLGSNARFLPALAVVGIMLAWHVARKDPWSIEWETLLGMALESALLAMPLLALGIAFARWDIHLPLYTTGAVWRDDTVLSLGAGIYEELVFRLVLMTLLMLILADLFKCPQVWSNLLMVLVSAVLFSLYHYLGHEQPNLRSFVFRTVAGIYFGVLFLTRGFGITAGCHIAYDIFIVGLAALTHH